jgi:type IV pilus assembly protein PilV
MQTTTPAICTARKQGGVALIEAMISVLVFSIGILALVGLQAMMAKNVTHTKLRGEASYLANQLIGQMWVDQANLGSYVITGGACATATYANCTNWRSAVQQALPGGLADVTINGNAVNISLSWQLHGEAPGRYQIDATITN